MTRWWRSTAMGVNGGMTRKGLEDAIRLARRERRDQDDAADRRQGGFQVPGGSAQADRHGRRNERPGHDMAGRADAGREQHRRRDGGLRHRAGREPAGRLDHRADHALRPATRASAMSRSIARNRRSGCARARSSSGIGALALMGASGFLTCIYAITKINYTYQIPLLIGITLRGRPGDNAKFHQSNGLYLEPVIALDRHAVRPDRARRRYRARSPPPIATAA